MARLRDVVRVEPVEYSTTRRSATPQERADDIMAAFADPTIGAVLATIGGQDQLTVLSHLDAEVILPGLKPFLGYSDNTNLLNWLWVHGMAGYHGGSTQVHVGPGPGIHAVHLASLQAALFDGGRLPIHPLAEFVEDEVPWSRPEALTDAPKATAATPWSWHRAESVVTAPVWGGNLEVLSWTLAVSRWMLPNEAYAGCVLLLETSKERPSATEVFRVLRTMGERGLLVERVASYLTVRFAGRYRYAKSSCSRVGVAFG